MNLVDLNKVLEFMRNESANEYASGFDAWKHSAIEDMIDKIEEKFGEKENRFRKN